MIMTMTTTNDTDEAEKKKHDIATNLRFVLSVLAVSGSWIGLPLVCPPHPN